MSIIIKRQIGNSTYAIESTSYRDELGRPRTKQRCLGRIDSDGVLISSKTKLPSVIKEVRKVTRKFILEPVTLKNESREKE